MSIDSLDTQSNGCLKPRHLVSAGVPGDFVRGPFSVLIKDSFNCNLVGVIVLLSSKVELGNDRVEHYTGAVTSC